MLRIALPTVSAKSAIEYYDTHLSQPLEGYYMDEHDQVEINGTWFGKTAAMFGLQNQPVDRDTFAKLANHINPLTGENLTVRRKDNRRVGFDVSMHLPKSVSAAAMFDERITDAFVEVGRIVMGKIEEDVEVRVRAGGQSSNRKSGNLIASEHIHKATRPLKSTGIPQPHWHLHYFVQNVSWDETEKKFKALELENVRFDGPYYEAMAHSLMATKLKELGYGIRRTSNAYEIAGIPDSVVDKYSKRSEEVAQLVEELGLISAEGKAQAGAWSRERKTKLFTLSQLRKIWVSQLTEAEKQAILSAKDGGSDSVGPWSATAKVGAKDAIDWALKYWHETHSTMNLRRVLATAMRHSVGHLQPAEVAQEMGRDDVVHMNIAGEKRVGARRVLEQEQAIINQAKEAKGSRRQLIGGAFDIETVIEDGKRFELNKDQQKAIRHIASSRDQFVLVEGKAGTGKTSMMKSAVEKLITDAGKEVITLAPTAKASRGVLRDEGFKDADTLQRFLDSPERMAEARHHIVWLDEGAVSSADDLAGLFAAAEQYEFDRVIVQGDPSQHESVKRSGGLFNLLKSHAGLKPAVLETVMRQKGDYAKAEKLLGSGKIEQGFDLLDKLGMIVEVPRDELFDKAANEANAMMEKGIDVGLASPTNAEGKRAVRALRDHLRQQGRLGRTERSFKRLESRHLKLAEREVASNYRKGDIVQFMKKVPGFKVGERVTVEQIEGDNVTVKRHAGALTDLPLDDVAAAKFDIFVERNVTFAEGNSGRKIDAGDHIAIRKNTKTLDGQALKRNQEFTVAGTRNGQLVLQGGGVIDTKLARKIKPVGDRIKFAANGKTKDGKAINNGDVSQIRKFTKEGDIELTDGRVIDKDFRQFDLGWSMTSHASQGSGFKKHIVIQSSDSFGPASNIRQFYVDTSRGKGRRGLMVFTDDKHGLKQAISRVGGDMSMTEAIEHSQSLDPATPSTQRTRYERMHSAAHSAMDWMKEKWLQLRYVHERGFGPNQTEPQFGN